MKTESKNRNNILIANTNQSTFYTQENKNIPFLNQNSIKHNFYTIIIKNYFLYQIQMIRKQMQEALVFLINIKD